MKVFVEFVLRLILLICNCPRTLICLLLTSIRFDPLFVIRAWTDIIHDIQEFEIRYAREHDFSLFFFSVPTCVTKYYFDDIQIICT